MHPVGGIGASRYCIWYQIGVRKRIYIALGFSKTRVFKKVSGSGFTGLNPPETHGQSGMANPQY